MCHGVFDVVHPGHVRHLLYAKSKADILVASITADRHITKGQHRPHRAAGSARASTSPRSRWSTTSSSTRTPRRSRTSRIIQPDYFAKGYEYTASGMPPKTAGGGGGRCSPTAARSSSRPATSSIRRRSLIDLAPPSIKLEKLQIAHGSERHHVRHAAASARRHERVRASTSSATPSSTATPTAR